MTFRKKAEQAADAAWEAFCKDPKCTSDVELVWDEIARRHFADAIERVAREERKRFATVALSEFCNLDELQSGKAMSACLEGIAAAIDAAEKGKS